MPECGCDLYLARALRRFGGRAKALGRAWPGGAFDLSLFQQHFGDLLFEALGRSGFGHELKRSARPQGPSCHFRLLHPQVPSL